VPLYWSHCGSFRIRDADYFERVLGCPRLETLDDMKRLGAEAVLRGFRAAKTNPMRFGGGGATLLDPGFLPGADPARTTESATVAAIAAQIEAFRDGAGPELEILVDANFGSTPEGLARIAAGIAPFGVRWFEADLPSPAALADLRRHIAMPLASGETLYGRAGFLAYLDARACDIAIVDIPWNGIAEAVRVAALAEAHQLNVAPHNFYGPLADLMTAHFCAAVPNLEMMEIEADDVPWKADLLTAKPVVAEGMFHLPSGPGWGADVDEEAVAEHKWRHG
jgi:L-alanine-DL-glutamate epimerase-like enolase superfamily enzyme